MIPDFFHWHMDSNFFDFKAIPTPIITMCKKFARMTGMNITIPPNLFICTSLAILMTVIEIYSGEWGAEKQESVQLQIDSFL